jgi:nucleotide-binding universal stress UspA family protein
MTHVSTRPFAPSAASLTLQDGPVLLATKPLSGSDAPLAVARWLATREERQLHVVSVLEPNDGLAGAAGLPPLPPQYYDEERAAVAASITRELVLHQNGTDDLRVEVLDGPSVPAIIEAARASHARVIVVGTGRHDRLGRFVYGERALQILSESDRPVLIVPRDAHAGAVTSAVVAVDFSPASLRAARAAIPMLSEGGRLILVHVKTAVSLHAETAGWWNDAYERRCADLFAQFQRQLPKLRGITIETKFLRGEAVRSILDFADSCEAGLIACGRLGHSFIGRVLAGSVSSALVRSAKCPVLVAPALACDDANGLG